MSDSRSELAGVVVKHLRDMVAGRFSVTHDEAAGEPDPAVSEVLRALLLHHDELTTRETERAHVEEELKGAVSRLEDQNQELERSRSEMAELAAELSTPI